MSLVTPKSNTIRFLWCASSGRCPQVPSCCWFPVTVPFILTVLLGGLSCGWHWSPQVPSCCSDSSPLSWWRFFLEAGLWCNRVECADVLLASALAEEGNTAHPLCCSCAKEGTGKVGSPWVVFSLHLTRTGSGWAFHSLARFSHSSNSSFLSRFITRKFCFRLSSITFWTLGQQHQNWQRPVHLFFSRGFYPPQNQS